MLFKRGEHIVSGKAQSIGIGENARDEHAQSALVFTWRVSLSRRGGDKRSNPPPGLDDTARSR